MNQQQKEQYMQSYNDKTHLYGRIGLWIGIVMLIAAPFVMGVSLDAMPDLGAVGKGLMQIAIIYIPSCIVEFLIYMPMLGAGGSYLAFITGNLINMKIPCAMNAKELVGAKSGTKENEIIATLSIATASLVTILVLAVGVALLIPLQPVLQAPALQPAFDSVVPALFGAMAYQYFRGHMNMAVWPLVLMGVLFTLLPSLVANTSMMVLPAGAAAFLAGYLLTKKA